MNVLHPWRRAQVLNLLLEGKSIRDVMRVTGAAKETVRRYRTLLVAAAFVGCDELKMKACACGREAGHREWCNVRYQKSPARQAVIRKLKENRR